MNNIITENNNALFGDGLGSPITESDTVAISIIRYPSYDSHVVSIVSSPLGLGMEKWATSTDEDLLFHLVGPSREIFKLEMKIRRLIPADFTASTLESSYCFQLSSELSYFGDYTLLESELSSIIEVCKNEIEIAGTPQINRTGAII